MNDTAVFLGRFSPFQRGHASIVEEMIRVNGMENCLIMIGSSNTLNERTPYTYEQRAEMVKAVFPEIKTIPLPDGKPGLVYFDGSTNEEWLDNIEKIQKEQQTKFVFYGGSKEDLEILAQRFETVVLVDRKKSPEITATNVRSALDKNDQEMLEKLLDQRVIPLAKKYYQEFKKNNE